MAAVLLAGVSPPAVRLCRASEFSDFRIPENRWYTLDLSLGGSGFWNREPNRSAAVVDASGYLNGAWSSERDDRSTYLWATALATGYRRVENRSDDYADFYRGATSHLRDHQDDRRATERWTLGAETRRYWFPVPLGLTLHGSADVGYDQLWSAPRREGTYADSTMRRRSVYARTDHQKTYDHALEGGASVGWGHVRNATGVFDAALLERRLLKLGVIERRFSPRTRRSIEALFYVRPGFGIVHHRPSRFFWRELESVLQEDGSMTEGGWRAFELIRADEGYVVPGARSPIVRRTGFYVGPSIAGQIRHVTRYTQLAGEGAEFLDDSLLWGGSSSYGFRERSVGDEVLAGAEAELHLPIGLGGQIDLSSRVVSRPKELPDAFVLSSNAAITWFVADRWGVSGACTHGRAIAGASPLGRNARWVVAYSLALGFYAEDRVKLSLAVSETQAAGRDFSRRQYVRNGRVSLGMTYSFLGAFDAPGRIEPVRSLSLTGAERDW